METQLSIINVRPDTDFGLIQNIANLIRGAIFEKNYYKLYQLYNIEKQDAPRLLKELEPDLANKCRFQVRSRDNIEDMAVYDNGYVLKSGNLKKYYMNTIYTDVDIYNRRYRQLFINLELMAGRSNENSDYFKKMYTAMLYELQQELTPVLILAVPNKYTGGNKITYPFDLIENTIRGWFNIDGRGISAFNPAVIPNIILIGYGER